MRPGRLSARLLGWAGSAAVAGGLVTGAAALALTAQRHAPAVLILDLGQMPPAAPALAAPAIAVLAEAGPESVSDAPEQPPPPAETAPPPPPAPPAVPAVLPPPVVPTVSEIALPLQDAPPAPPPPKVAEVEPEPAKVSQKPRAKPEKPAKPPQPKAASKPEPAAPASASAPSAGQKARGGAKQMSAAAYARAVMKKVRATRRQGGAGRGSVTVGFTIAPDGGLAGVQVLASSGNAALDAMAQDHIRRAAPFAPPPKAAGRNFSFEFVGK